MFSVSQKKTALTVVCISTLFGALATFVIAVSFFSGTPENALLQRSHAVITHPSAPYFFLGLFGITAILATISGRVGSAIATTIVLVPAILSFIFGPINTLAAPKGAIIMVAQTYTAIGTAEITVCPEGWSAFDKMAARMPLGAGVPDETGLTTRQLVDEQGGAEILTLSENHIPQHDHSHNAYDRLLVFDRDRTAWEDRYNTNLGGREEPNLFDSRPLLPFGGGQNGSGEPLSHMPPFQVVQFCIKN